MLLTFASHFIVQATIPSIPTLARTTCMLLCCSFMVQTYNIGWMRHFVFKVLHTFICTYLELQQQERTDELDRTATLEQQLHHLPPAAPSHPSQPLSTTTITVPGWERRLTSLEANVEELRAQLLSKRDVEKVVHKWFYPCTALYSPFWLLSL